MSTSKRKVTLGPMDLFVVKKICSTESMASVPESINPSSEDSAGTTSKTLYSEVSEHNKELDSNIPLTSAKQETNPRDPAIGSKSAKNFVTEGAYQPVLATYPCNKYGRKFRKEWYNTYTWLEYSPTEDRAFCFPCRAYAGTGSGGYAEETFTSAGFGQWSNAIKAFNNHSVCGVHKNAEVALQSLKSSIKIGSVASQLNRQYSNEVAENRNYMKKVCENIVFCARQGIALRGHDESSSSKNKGNLLELMDLRSNDNELIKRIYKDREKSFVYLHPSHQNDILQLLGRQVTHHLLINVKAAKYFAILGDETQDISRDEQLALFLRYVDEVFNAHECFIGFYKAEKLDGESLAALIKNVISSLGLDLLNVCAQCYDGAANMRGPYSGVASRILAENPKAIYIHCYAHILNLCIVSSCSNIPAIRNCLDTLNDLHTFVEGSTKRHNVFQKLRSKDFYGGPETLKSLSDTRWSCRIEAIKAVLDNFESVVQTFEEISQNDQQNGGKANSLLICITRFDFIFTLLLLRRVLNQCNILSKLLQSSTLHYPTVKAAVKSTVEVLNTFRSDAFFSQIWEFSANICEKNGYSGPVLPRSQRVPAKLGGGQKEPFQDVKSFYRVRILYALVDSVTHEIENRFKENDLNLLIALNSSLTGTDTSTVSNEINLVCETYSLSQEELVSELKMFYCMDETSDNKTPNFEERLDLFKKKNLIDVFPNTAALFKILLTVPMSSASCERSFSGLRRLKTYIRNTTGQERLSSLALLAIEREVPLDFDDVITKFALLPSMGKRRLALL